VNVAVNDCIFCKIISGEGGDNRLRVLPRDLHLFERFFLQDLLD